MILIFNLNRIIQRLLPNDWDEVAVETISIIIQIIIYTIILLLMKRFIETILGDRLAKKLRIHEKSTSQRRSTIRRVVQNLALYILYFIYAYAILSVIGVPVGTLVAGAGIAGVAIGLGAQDLINDMINGFFIIFEDQYKVGDLVKVHEEGIEGTVIDVGIRTTIIRASSGEIYYIPNSSINIVNNRSRCHRQINIEMPLTDDYNISLLEKTMEETTLYIKEKYASIMREEPEIIGIIRGEGLSFHYRVSFMVAQGEEYRHTSIFYQEFFQAFQANNIPFPTSIYEEV